MGIFSQPLQEVIQKRRSVRTYLPKPLEKETLEGLFSFAKGFSNPFSVEISYYYAKSGAQNVTLGTYGMIKNAVDFIGASVPERDFNLEALGYSFEGLVLYAASLGLGSCYLGGTFQKEEFLKAMAAKEGEIFPIVSPFGYPAKRERLSGALVRNFIGAGNRKPWEELFFSGDFSAALSQSEAGEFSGALEGLRLSPSASNKQPWRVVKEPGKDVSHFYELKAPGYSDRFPYDIQRIDMGIAACHFALFASEREIPGGFKANDPGILLLPDLRYVFSWTKNK